MFKPIAQFLDRLAIKAACGTVQSGFAVAGQGTAAHALLQEERFLLTPFVTPKALQFEPDGIHFKLASSFPLTFQETNTIYGKFFRCGENWRTKPVVLLIHGWNGEDQYIKLFGWYARKLNKCGLNAVAIELPFHFHRKPVAQDKVRNFISDDLVTMLKLTQQCIADIGSTLSFFKNEGCPTAGLWGFSLGAWLAGLFVCSHKEANAAVLATPVPSLDEAIQNLAFCAPIRTALHTDKLDLSLLNLTSRKPLVDRSKVLVTAGIHDIFASRRSVEDLCKAWDQPETWWVNHGHISMLAAPGVIRRTCYWLKEALAPS